MIRSSRRRWWLPLLALLATTQGVAGAWRFPQTPHVTMSSTNSISMPTTPPFVPGEALVAFNEGVSAFDRSQLHSQLDTRVLWRSHHLAIELVRSNRGDSTDLLIRRYASDPLVRYVEPNYILHIAATVPDDTYFATDQWALRNTGQTGGTPGADIDATLAWDVQKGSSSVIVAVLDTGVKYDHTDLASNIWSNDDSCTGGVDNDHNGFVDDCRGWDFVNNDNDPMDDVGHGTHVAGIIAAASNNSAGVAGVTWFTAIMPVKVFNSSGSGSTGDIIAGIEYAVDNKSKIINFSAASTVVTDTLFDEIRMAKDNDVLFVCAAGAPISGTGTDNDDPSSHWYPCYADHRFNFNGFPLVDYRDLTNILCVTSTDDDDQKEGNANFGSVSVDLGAPGVAILSTALTGGSECVTSPKAGGLYAFCTGTSMATPHVAGVAALLKAQRPTATFENLKWSILDSVDSVLPPLVTVTGGRLNANGALSKIGDLSPPTAPTNLVATGSNAPQVDLTWTASSDNVGVHHYEVLRRNPPTFPSTYILVASVSTTTYTDTTVLGAKTYVYKVRAVDAAGNVSADSNLDLGTTVSFTDPALGAGVTIKAVHITELRTAIGYARTAASLGAFSYTDPSLPTGTVIRAVHVSQLRSALDAARSGLGLSTGGYTDGSLTGVTVKTVHLSELRTRVH